MIAPVLSLREISKSFGLQRALIGVNLDLAPGRIHALVGENGSGKSTLIKVLSGYHRPTPGGSMEVEGKTVPLGSPTESRRHGLRFVHQNLGLVEEFSVLENFGLTDGFPTRRGVIDWGGLRLSATTLLKKLDIKLNLNRHVSELTAVERSSIAIARALGASGDGTARVLVLDEPTAALPVDDVERLHGLVRGVAGQGVAVLYVSHRLDEVLELSDHVTALRDGRVVASVTATGLDREKLVRLIVGSDVKNEPHAPPQPVAAHRERTRIQASRVSAGTISGISLEVGPGEIVGIAGLDGSGRESIARTLCGASGQVGELRIDGERVFMKSPRDAARAGVALVLANRDLGAAVGQFSVGENISHVLYASTHSLSAHHRGEYERARDWIDRLSIRPRREGVAYAALSGGNKQKVIFAKWLAIKPKVLVLDDPTSGVDVGARGLMYAQTRAAAADGISVIIASSDTEDLVRMCSRVLVLVDGQVACELNGSDVTEEKLAYAMSSGRTNSGMEQDHV